MSATILRFLLLLALLLLGRATVHAQTLSASVVAADTAASSAPADPRYAPAAELTEMKAQLQTLLQAYDQLVTRYNAQTVKLEELERKQPTPALVPAGRSRALRHTALSGSF